MAVLLETSLGDLVFDLLVDEAPKACTNFLKLCKIKYYNNCLIHTVQKDYICLSGDPTNTGTGGQSVWGEHFEDELLPTRKHEKFGTLAMANEGAGENGSQFYITLRDKIEQLDGKHTIFGLLAEGEDVLKVVNQTMCDEKNQPYQNIRIWHTTILEDPIDDPEGLEALIPPKSPDVIVDEAYKKIQDAEDEAQLSEQLGKTLAKSQATSLELLHDIPDADIKPPDTVLFVCKLNPITQDGDLELIFSRFGAIKSCHVVRDWKTGDSLQYAFIDFENKRSSEQAYFKMQDCLIDDRRIWVNFSQSVAKEWNKFRRNGAVGTAEDAKSAQMSSGAPEGKGGKGKGKNKGKQQIGGFRETKYGLVMNDDTSSLKDKKLNRSRSRSRKKKKSRSRSRDKKKSRR
eukprot:gnl/MRDRNA2_/MRDRNA2_98287_c0_seq1.p1 gnl/MRDRNA2_/MRDRNA2_98287_c0~~gnl/MRDRNA2_/MRDRNA2_98287_c0_seq1.p1  ORF type:complete len:427 (-),score=107.15 gnl/MRDRNA2_/MRDRNA2_98287_c0_seq1:41-1243(-)